ncbi:MAG: FAD-dependent monooxygenase [Phycisphaeraceae bacterium]|nr:FAD-dependent monooxygenase [Phycisphaeraceae bacterium]
MSNDVIVVGAGPVGLTAALLLARHGLRVEVIDKNLSPATEPRAVSLDDEGLRIWQSCGVGELLRDDWAAGEQGQCICTYQDGRGRPFLRIRQRTSELGYPHAALIHQGLIEQKLQQAAGMHPLIRLRRGLRIDHVEQTGEAVTLQGARTGGESFESRAPWMIACDGANSTVRRELGIGMEGASLEQPWLVANLTDHGDPGHVTISCRTKAAAVTLPLPHGLRRVEVQLDAGDDGAWISDEGQVRKRLASCWPGAMEARIVSAAICRFRARVAAQWRLGQVFLAGDAAHVMPPFAGQGLGAGLRDAGNLTFKIAGVVQGWLSPQVLETYELERRPHVERIMRLSCRLGRLMSPGSRLEGTLTHTALRLVGVSRRLSGRWLLRGPNIQPTLKRGFLMPSPHAGRYLPQPEVVGPDHRRVRLDEMLGRRMTWIILAGRERSRTRLRPPLLQPCDTVITEGRDFHDPDKVLRRRYGPGSVLLVRPDRVVYCHIKPSRKRPSSTRRPACLSDRVALHEVRETVSPAWRRPSPSPVALPTAPIRA